MAATALAQQLAHLADNHRVGKASLLYEPRQAADIDLQTLYNLGLNGFSELCNLDVRFRSYSKSLFGRAGLDFNRLTAGREAVAKLDASLATFARLLSGYFLLPAASKALEYLIRRFAIHEHNVESLIAAFLPYHETVLFVRLLQLVPPPALKASPWDFLAAAQLGGAAPPRAALVSRCAQDGAVLSHISSVARAHSRPADGSSVLLAFYGVLLAEAVSASRQPPEALAQRLLPYVIDGFARDAAAEHAAGAFMVAAQLAVSAPPPPAVAATLLEGAARCPHAALLPAVLRLSAVLLACLPPPASLPERYIMHIAHQRGLPKLLSQMAASAGLGDGCAAPFVGALLAGIASRAAHHANYEALLTSLLTDMPADAVAPHVATVLAALLRLVAPRSSSAPAEGTGMAADVSESVARFVRLLDLRAPVQLDAAVNTILAQHCSSKLLFACCSDRHSSKKPKEKGGAAADGVQPDCQLLLFLQAALTGSLGRPMSGPASTVAACLDHPQPHFRLLALQQLAGIVQGQEPAGAESAMLSELLPRRMLDEDASVAAAALALDMAPKILPPATFVDTVVTALHRAAVALSRRACPEGQGPFSEPAGVGAVAKQAARLLSRGPMASFSPPLQMRAGAAVLGHLLALGDGHRLPRLVLRQLQDPATEDGGPPLHVFAGLPPGRDAEAEGSAEARRPSKKARNAALNLSVLVALASGLVSDGDGPDRIAELSLLRPFCGPLARHTLLLALLAAVRRHPVRAQLLEALKKECWEVFAADFLSADKLRWPPADSAVWPSGLPPASHWDVLDRDVDAAHCCALWQASLAYCSLLPVVKAAAEFDPRALPHQRVFAALSALPLGVADRHFSELLSRIVSPAHKQEFLERLALEDGAETVGLAAVSQLARLVSSEAVGLASAPSLVALSIVILSDPKWPAVRHAALNLCQTIGDLHVPASAASTPAAAASALARSISGARVRLETADGTAALGRVLGVELGGEAAPAFEAPGNHVRAAMKPALISALCGIALRSTWVAHHAAAAASLIRSLREASGRRSLLLEGSGLDILQQLVDDAVDCDEPHAALAAELLSGTPALIATLPPAGPAIWTTLLKVLQLPYASAPNAGAASTPASLLRAAVYSGFGKSEYLALGAGQRGQLLLSLMRAVGSEPLPSAREAAYQTLKLVPAAVLDVIPLLSIKQPASHASRASPASRKKPRSAGEAAMPETVGSLDGGLTPVRSALELLQWKDLPVHECGATLALALFDVVRSSLEREAGEAQAVAAEASAPLADSSVAGYLINLALSALSRLARHAAGAISSAITRLVGAFDVDVLVHCASGVDPERRAESLEVLAALSKIAPARLVPAIVPLLTAVLADAQPRGPTLAFPAQRWLQDLLAAVVPPWLKMQGSSTFKLVDLFVGLLSRASRSRQLPILTALLQSLPSEGPGEPSAFSYACVRLLETASCGEGEGQPENDWASDLTAGLCAWASPVMRLTMLAGLLKSATENAAADSSSGPRSSKRLFGFVLAELKSAVSRGVPLLSADPALAAAEHALLSAALMALQLRRRSKSARSALFDVLDTLGELLVPSAYVAVLVQLLSSDEEASLRRLVQRLLISRLSALQAARQPLASDVSAASTVPQEGDAVSAAYLALCPVLTQLLAKEGQALGSQPSASAAEAAQGTLVLCADLARAYGRGNPALFLPCLKPVLTLLSSPSSPLAASAFCTVGVLLVTLGPHALPQLPHAVPEILGAAEAALHVYFAEASAMEEDASPPVSVLALAGVAAIATLTRECGSFLSPYLGRLIAIVLAPSSNSTRADGVVNAVRSLRASLPSAVPPRLLLPPLYLALSRQLLAGNVDGAGPASAVEMIGACAALLDRPSVNAAFPAMADQLIAAMDTRRSGRPEGSLPFSCAGLDNIESATITAVGALVMRLSEAAFRPFFMRIVEWARAPPPPGSVVASPQGRLFVLMRLTEHLGARLKGVFLPFGRYLIEDCVAILTSRVLDAAGTTPRRKRKKLADSPSGTDADVEVDGWRLRVATLRAVTAVFSAVSSGSLDGPTFEQIADPVVAQLEAAGCSAHLEPDVADDIKTSIVACAGTLAAAVGSDAHWKSLNRSVLMATRSAAPRTRILALAVTSELIGRLAEEYLSLVPESLPFLSELLDDPEAPVEAAARAIVKQLESLSGESLAAYM